jgi:starch synthase
MARSLIKPFRKLVVPPAPNGPLKVLIVAPEVSPYANVGGFARVTAYLSRALIDLGHDVRLFMPKFGFIDEEKYPMEVVYRGLKVPTGTPKTPHLICNVKLNVIPGGAPTYFLENMEYYEKRANVYGYSDDPRRWALLSRGALEFLRTQDWSPNIVHCNDWETGFVPNYLRTTYEKDEKLLPISTVFTIHNLMYQGIFDHRTVSELDFDDGRSQIASFFSERLNKQNFMRRGIIFSDVVNTVSKTYAKEALTPEYGEGLHKLLLEVRSKLYGILNGIDYTEFNPQKDPLLEQNYGVGSLDKRVENKLALQREFDLKEDEDSFTIGFIGRLSKQKGLDLILEILPHFFKEFKDAQFFQVGGGDGDLIDALKKLKSKFPDQVGIHPMPNFTLPRLLFSGCDVMLMPSRFEPSGQVQLEAMRYGCVPIVRGTGGLNDTVINFDPRKNSGTGFVFKDFDAWPFFAKLVQAYGLFQHKKIWKELVERAMKADFSWKASAREYVELYKTAIHRHRRVLVAEGQIAPRNGEGE